MMKLFRWFLRQKQSRGHGVHSPFAFDLITRVIHSPHDFYAFSGIRETLLLQGFDPGPATRFNRLSFRLVHFLQARNVLEINSGNGVNTLFLTSPSSHVRCRCVEEDKEKAAMAEHLWKQTGNSQSEIFSSLSACEGEKYDAIFVHTEGKIFPDIPTLKALSHSATFWVFHSLKKGRAKQCWNEIIRNEIAMTTFDLNDSGIAFLRPAFHKTHYFV